MKKIIAIVLAAGSSTRFGESKQLLQYKGKSLLRLSVDEALQSTCEGVIVVLGANAESHAAELQGFGVELVINETWKNGMGNSIKAGLNYLQGKNPELDGILIMVCDQPMITSDHLDKLIETFSKTNNPVVASTYANSAGVPALFSRSMLGQLLSIPDDKGAKGVIQSTKEIELVEFKGGEIDIDTIEDYKRLH